MTYVLQVNVEIVPEPTALTHKEQNCFSMFISDAAGM